VKLGVPEANIVRVDSGEEDRAQGVKIRGVYAIPTDQGVVDTTGYRIEFPNGRSLYHTSDTAYSELLAAAAPCAEVLLVCINGKFDNLNVTQAVDLAARVKPKVAIPNHYDVMALNSENPDTFAYFMHQKDASIPVRILKVLEPFLW